MRKQRIIELAIQSGLVYNTDYIADGRQVYEHHRKQLYEFARLIEEEVGKIEDQPEPDLA